MTWVERDAAVVWHGFTQMAAYAENLPVIVEAGEGRELIDVAGNRYLDAISSLWVTTLGHRVPELDDAVRGQLDRIAHSTMLGNGNRVVIELSEALAAVVPVDGPHFLYAGDGATAVEQALKIAFQYWVNRGEPRTGFVGLGGAYHGDTIGALSLGDRGFGTTIFEPLLFPVRRAATVEDAVDAVLRGGDELAAVIVEPLVQAANAMAMLDPGALADLGAACAETGVLLICDEVATGFGRTGTLFASEQCGLRPDLLVLGKGMSGGYLPLSATVAADRVFRAFLGPDLSDRTLYHGHSYGGNALACAVALRHLQLLEEWDVLANVRAREAQLRAGLDEAVAPLAAVGDVRLRGLMGGVDLLAPRPDLRWGRRVCAAAVRRGVLLRPIGDTVILMAPLTLSAEEADRIVTVLRDAILEVCRP
ncbi:MAG TPA: adenosylmethionine--8-amino-7-oxononanoate transaminase [Acidimicrobiales bacterium]|nr:adenosylmethionine--8-amino-7-oxononanoate transaminase [Acidimicrobiales bacterium]